MSTHIKPQLTLDNPKTLNVTRTSDVVTKFLETRRFLFSVYVWDTKVWVLHSVAVYVVLMNQCMGAEVLFITTVRDYLKVFVSRFRLSDIIL